MAASFVLPADVHSHDVGWGPPADATIPGLGDFPIESIVKTEKVGRVCDFSASGQRAREMRGKGRDIPPPEDGDEQFKLVDTRPTAGRGKGFGKARGRGRGKGQGLSMLKQDDRFSGTQMAGGKGGKWGGGSKGGFGGKGDKGKGGKGKGKAKGRGKGKGKGKGRFGGNMRQNTLRSFKDWSIQTQPEWDVVTEINLVALAKLQIDSRLIKKEDLCWCGKLADYDKKYDRIQPKSEKQLSRYENVNFYNVTTVDDPYLSDLLQGDEVHVVVTDHILACLMACGRSIYSWDIVITKVDGKIVFDKRDGSHIDFLTVNETAGEPPSNEDRDAVNAPVRLGQEASCINQNFSQQVLDMNTEKEQEYPNPFEDDDPDAVPAASGALRYRKITLPGDDRQEGHAAEPIVMAIRAEVDARMPSTTGEPQYASLKCLNEYAPTPSMNWRKHLDSQRGAVLATELKNNAFRLARWIAQAVIADCQVMKFGYVSRVNPKDPWTHALLNVQTYRTGEFAAQIGMSENNAWGIVRSIIDAVMGMENGKYLLLKDPNKSVIRLYSVPWDTFDEEEEDEDEEEEEEGVAPP